MTPLWSDALGRWVPNSECDASGEPYVLGRKETWTLVGTQCLELGHLKWARDAFDYALSDDPPLTWPAGHPAGPGKHVRAAWYKRLVGWLMLKGITFRNG